MRYGSIYIATNKHTGEQYVGQTRQPVEKRWAAHWRTANCPTSRKAKFQNALVAFGGNAFDVVESFVAFDADALNGAEMALIADLHPAYNSTRGGKGLRPVVVSDEVKRKRSHDAKARWANPEWKAKTVAALKKAHRTPEAIERGKKLAAFRGEKIRLAAHKKKEKAPPADRAALTKAGWLDPVIRQKRIDGLRAACQRLEVKAKKSMASKGRKHTQDAIAQIAKSKWRPVYCPELGCTFLSMSAAADFLGVLRTTVSNAVKQKGRVLRQYSLERVA
jgi:group I intron endonuclease